MATTVTATERWAADTAVMAQTCGEIAFELPSGERCTVFRPFPRQEEFCKLLGQVRYRLIGGAAGPGKTLTLLMQNVLVANLLEDGRGVDTLCLRRTVPQLEVSFLREFRKHVPRELYRTYNDQKKIITWHNGATTKFGSMQYEKDVWDYAGTEWARIAWDELCQFLLRQWETLSTWNRCSKHAEVPVGMDGGANPIGPGADFVKALFVDKRAPRAMDRPELYDPRDYAFVPARITDNPIYANDEAYLASLNRLPRALRDAMLLGLWTLAAGAYFDIWDPAAMTIRPEAIARQEWWPHWLSIDWGFEHESAVYAHTTTPEGGIRTYRELCVRHTDPEPLAEQIIEANLDSAGKREVPEHVFLSPDAFARRTSANTIAEQMNVVFRKAGWPLVTPADDDRIGGWQLMYGLLRSGKWLIGTNCERLIEVLPTLQRDEKRVEDIQKVGGDDPADSARYGIYSKLKGMQPPVEMRQAAALEKIIASAPRGGIYEIQLALAQQKERGAKSVRMKRHWRWRN